MEETIELRELFIILKKRLLMICVLGFLALVGSGAISFFVLTPQFQTSTELIVNNSATDNQMTTADIQVSLQLINTYREIITRPIILDPVIENLELDMSASQLRSLISVSNTNNSQVLAINVRYVDPAVARDIANEVARIFAQEIPGIMNVENVSILTPAGLSTSPVEPRPMMNMAIGLVVGLMAGVGLAFVLEYLDTKIKTEQDIEKLLGIPVLGVIPTTTVEDFNKKA